MSLIRLAVLAIRLKSISRALWVLQYEKNETK